MDLSKFVETWERSAGVAQVAEAMGMTRSYASTTAWRLRQIGVNLKRMKRGPAGAPPDAEALNRLAREVAR